MKKILITGTHFTPAQAVAEKLIENYKVQIIYIGRNNTMDGGTNKSFESQVFSAMGIKFISIITGRIQGTFSGYSVLSILKIPIGFIQAFWFLIIEKPDVILSFGGYVSIPLVIWGWLLSIPIIIHEQTLVSGLSTEISAYLADKIAVTFINPDNPIQKKFPEKIIFTGNPLRLELRQKNIRKSNSLIAQFCYQAKKNNKPLIYVTGGNQGAHAINQKILEIVTELTQFAYVIHQTGDSKHHDYEQCQKVPSELKNPERYFFTKWVDVEDLALIFKSANLAITRAGINTLYELAFFKIPAIYIPYPHLYRNEQVVNAKFFESLNLGKIILQRNMSKERLLFEIKTMLKFIIEKESLNKIEKILVDNADQRVALETMLLVRKPE